MFKEREGREINEFDEVISIDLSKRCIWGVLLKEIGA
jgi:hypothetical protein